MVRKTDKRADNLNLNRASLADMISQGIGKAGSVLDLILV